MWRCPICSNQQDSNPTICRECGFDSSSDVEFYPTLMIFDALKHRTVQSVIQAKKTEQDAKYIRLEQKMAEFERRIARLEMQLSLTVEDKGNNKVTENKKETDPEKTLNRHSVPDPCMPPDNCNTSVNKVLDGNLTPGAAVLFGNYPQGKNGERRPIEWIVLEIAAGKALLVSKYALEFRQYHGHNEAVTWESCNIRQWLNGAFLRDSFTEAECGRIVNQKIEVPHYQYLAIDVGAPTIDRVFLLSSDEIKKYFPNRRSRLLKGTEWTEWVKACNEGSRFKMNWWWTRTPGFRNDHAVFVDEKGEFDTIGCRVALYKIGVRPALWVSLEK